MPVKHTWQTGCNKETGQPEYTTATINKGKAIREFCKSCYAYHSVDANIRECPSTTCPLYPFRFGKDPGNTRKLTDEERKVISERFKKVAKRIRSIKKDK